MMRDPKHTRQQALVYAIHQGRVAASELKISAYIHDLSDNRFLVNAQCIHLGEDPMCYVLPNGQIMWNA